MVNDEFYLNLALQEAWKHQGLTYPNPAVGAVVIDENGKILSIASHKKQGKAHAELNAIKDAYTLLTNDKTIQTLNNPSQIHTYLLKNHNNLFKNCKIYITLEPCNHFGSTPPCSLLLSTLSFEEVIIGSFEENSEAKGGIQRLEDHGIKVKTGILKKECDTLLYPFKKWKENRFVFFKIATNLNGSYDTGIISSKASREFVHKLRDKIDLLVIGGNTVRVDRPTLDSRMVGGKAPDVLIYSKRKDFDKTIPLFGVKNRKVYISNSLEIIKKYNFIMIEGGDSMLKATQNMIDWYLFFISAFIKPGKNLDTKAKLRFLWQNKSDTDIMLWLCDRNN
jgi:diaminohydroxyphosphoribosylaminopyrimidine deaminase/5-amino-6-(5-phosphoribosylamino)uracil reductase